MATPAESHCHIPLEGHQQVMANKVLAETVGELAKQGLTGEELRKRAIDLAAALCAGIHHVATTAPCNKPSASCEPQ
ncbi:hypothetical protein HaloA020_22790 [Halomonas sp. A020]|nr:hypothetical protein HaloA020_22790 [Halomonas sp. A020]